MSEYFLGNGNKRPKRSDYMEAFGWNGGMYYTIDKLRYENKVQARKELKENNKKASKYASTLGWGILPASSSKRRKK